MQIITLTTDVGLSDHYAAALKGTIFSANPGVIVVDITHDVRAFEVVNAVYHIDNCFRDFPAGTIHVCGVESEPVVNFGSEDNSSLPAIMLFEGHYFVSNDNGFFGLLLKGKQPEKLWKIDDVLSNPNLFRFPAKSILVPTACRIAAGEEISSFATETTKYRKALTFQPIVEENLIKGNIIHIDHFGNLITNVTKELFYQFGENIPFTIFLRNKEYHIDEISNGYKEVAEGESVGIFNSSGYLEIAINQGAKSKRHGADTLLGMNINDVVRIEFTPRGSKETIESLF